MSIPRSTTGPVDLREAAPEGIATPSNAIGRWTALAACFVVAAGGATAFGFWMGAGHQLVKLEAALALATVGLGVVPAAMLLRPWGGASEANAAKRPSFQLLLCFAAGLLSAAAALVHFAVIKQHADEYWLYGAFFVVLGLVQLAWAVLIMSVSSRTLYALGALGNAAVVAIFVVTRTVGTLVGPEASEPATVGFGDIATTVFEALIVALSVALLSGVRPRLGGPPAALAAVASLLTLLLAPQTALALHSAVSSAPFVPHAG